ncbi:MAG: ABC transporter ATP-binding protein [Eubacteriales bacterium]|nr:ABC transporter ATP-binding protein [Eubacteriales bacterium]
MHELKTEGLTKEYKGKQAVSNVSISLTSGVYGLLGENGAGKTTLMRMLCGILKQDGGRILCDGTEIQRMGGGYRRLLGYLPQNFGYYPDYSARRFLMYMAALKALPRDYSRKRADELLELVNLQDGDKKMKTFSGGMIKRVGIAQALLNDPEILILDEPTSGLDPNERVRFRNIISSLSKDRIIILSTHIVSDIEYIADEILMMKQGQLVSSGTVAQMNNGLGKFVWEYMADAQEAELLREKYVIANLKNHGNGVLLRIISREKPAPGAVNVEPTLEDTYLYYLNRVL